MIRVKNIKKSFNEKPVLKGISCEFEKGKTSLIIGQTGSGKTVFMKCLLGLHKHDSGKIIFNDRDFEKMNDNQNDDLIDENSIDKNNIRIATHKAMHRAIKDIIKENDNNLLLVGHGDGIGKGDLGYKFLKLIFKNKISRFPRT